MRERAINRSIYTRRDRKGHKTIVEKKNNFQFEAQKEKIKKNDEKFEKNLDFEIKNRNRKNSKNQNFCANFKNLEKSKLEK